MHFFDIINLTRIYRTIFGLKTNRAYIILQIDMYKQIKRHIREGTHFTNGFDLDVYHEVFF